MPYLTFQLQTDYDLLRIYEGNSTNANLLAELTGYEIPANVTSCRGNQMHVVFTSDGSETKSGYNAKIHTSESIHVAEPGASGYCTSNCPCGANEGHCQSHDQCVSGHFCLLDSSVTSLGFTNTTSCCQGVDYLDVSCGYADVNNGLLLSPNYPNNYQNNIYCDHQLSTEPGKIITVEFESFSVSCVSKYKNLQQASKD